MGEADETRARTPENGGSVGIAPTWPDGTIRLPDAIEAWLDGHFAGDKDDDADEMETSRNVAAVTLWSLIYRQGDVECDTAALVALLGALGGVYNGPSTTPYHWWRLPIEGEFDAC